MSPARSSRRFVWLLGPLAVAVALLTQFVAANRIGLLPFNQSFGAGKDGEWLTLLSTITGLAALTSALGGLVASSLLSGVMTRLGVTALVVLAGLASLPFLRGAAAQARNADLATGGPVTSVTTALAIGLALGALTAWAVHRSDWQAVASGLAVTIVALWVMAAVSTRVVVGVPPLGMPSDLLRTRNLALLGGAIPLPAFLWLVIGAASALLAKRFSQRRAIVMLSGVVGAVLVSLAFFAARPRTAYSDHLTVQNSAFGFMVMLVGGALVGSALATLLPSVWGTQGAQDSVKRREATANDAN